MYPHRIRLRGPWECEPLACTDPAAPLPAPRRMTMPCHWADGGLPGFRGRVRFRRRFGYPGRIDSFERVWLTFDDIDGTAAISLNGEALGTLVIPGEFDVTARLQPRNELIVDLDGGERGGLSG